MPYDANRGGHAPDAIRAAFLEWLDDPAQTVVKVDMGMWDFQRKPLSWLFGQLWNCTDILPGLARVQVSRLLEGEPDDFRNTYAGAVRRLKGEHVGD